MCKKKQNKTNQEKERNSRANDAKQLAADKTSSEHFPHLGQRIFRSLLSVLATHLARCICVYPLKRHCVSLTSSSRGCRLDVSHLVTLNGGIFRSYRGNQTQSKV